MWIGIYFIASLYNCALHIQYIPTWHLTYLYSNILIEQSPETTLVYEAIILSHIASLEVQNCCGFGGSWHHPNFYPLTVYILVYLLSKAVTMLTLPRCCWTAIHQYLCYTVNKVATVWLQLIVWILFAVRV